jgi:phosphonate transport system substrate-binding protein
MLRRTILGAALATLAALAPAHAQDWKAKYPELVFAIIPSENASGVVDRYTPFTEHLSKELGTKVTLRVAADYAAVIEGQRAGNIHIASYGPSSFARALMTGAKIEAVAIEVSADGTKGYYSVLWVKKDAPYQSIQDLKGKNLCLVDPNSTSGNNVPRFAMSKMGITPESFFGKVVYSGSHENAVIGVGQGVCDAGFNWWNDDKESNLLRMAAKNMVKAEDFRMIFKSEQIVNSPFALVSTMPDDLKKAITAAILALPEKNQAAFDKIYDGKQKPWAPATNADYEPIIELNKFVDSLRRAKS